MDPLSSLFGEGDGICEQWFAYHQCVCKEIKQEVLDFLHISLGCLEGTFHDSHGWIINLNVWGALVQYVNWCSEENVDFEFHLLKVLENDVFYMSLAEKKLKEFGA
jgi:hypothetical protein